MNAPSLKLNHLTKLLSTSSDDQNIFGFNESLRSALSLLISVASSKYDQPICIITPDNQTAWRIEQEIKFFRDQQQPVVFLDGWGTLPYDIFSPDDALISERLGALNTIQALKKGIVIVSVTTLMHRIAPASFIRANRTNLVIGQKINTMQWRNDLASNGYRQVSEVNEHGEFAIRGEIIDLFPMGRIHPVRIDLFDDEIESLREFDPETQRSSLPINQVILMPAREYPLNESSITQFTQAWGKHFKSESLSSPILDSIRRGHPVGGIEYYLPLFFDELETLLDYFSTAPLIFKTGKLEDASFNFYQEASERYEQLRHDLQRPLVPVQDIFLSPNELTGILSQFDYLNIEQTPTTASSAKETPQPFVSLPPLKLKPKSSQPFADLSSFIHQSNAKILITAQTLGHYETLRETLATNGLHAQQVDSWKAFLEDTAPIAMAVAQIEKGIWLPADGLAVVSENDLQNDRPVQKLKSKSSNNIETIIRDLTDLSEGAPVVHEEHGVGRFRGLVKMAIGANDIETELLVIEYAGGDKLYVPVSSLHLISRYTGATPENAPWHRLGSDQWQKARQKAAKRAFDVATELLEINARRAAKKGLAMPTPENYSVFSQGFPFEETPDQLNAIEAVVQDLNSGHPMDRVICGDVGFGKTEVALRAAFIAVQNGYQVAVLVPTTLLAEQHLANFKDRFSEWPVRCESLSRFRSALSQKKILEDLKKGTVDVVIGTHKLLSPEIKFRQLGLIIVDEEHRFGVRHKEKIKKLRSEVHLLTLTATPIPRTLNMTLSGLRDLSIIATPPPRRQPIKTFIHENSDRLITEACMRELSRGGQIYYLHNEVKTIEKVQNHLKKILPQARIGIAHGQMRERELEKVMLDFYHRHQDILLATTIIESGIDVPNANTIIIDRADKLGLAQLHQLRGRVGRSHHRAYAYLFTPPRTSITKDAIKRLEAIENLGDLGIGFSLATYDLEIRGAGELLGSEQSGQIQEIGFNLYQELLERTVQALKNGEIPEIENTEDTQFPSVELGINAILPDDYVADIHTRLILYKRIASCQTKDCLKEIQIELIDRFGLLPESTKNLFSIAEIKIDILALGITKIEAGKHDMRIIFSKKTAIEPETLLNLIQSDPTQFKLYDSFKLRVLDEMLTPDSRLNKAQKIIEILGTKHRNL